MHHGMLAQAGVPALNLPEPEEARVLPQIKSSTVVLPCAIRANNHGFRLHLHKGINH